MKNLLPLLLLLLLAPSLVAQDGSRSSALQLDPDDRYWDGRFGNGNGLTGPWYSTSSALVRTGGFLYAAGQFSHAGGIRANNIARYDGTRWHPLVAGGDTGTNRAITSLASINGDLYAGGYFDSAGGVHTGAVARWDGAAWHRVGGGLRGTVSTLAVIDGDLYAGGSFTIGDSGLPSQVARWDGATWNPVGGPVNGHVHAIAPSSRGIVIGGAFDTADGRRTGPLAVWSFRGGSWGPLGDELRDTLSAIPQVYTLAVEGDHIYVGGRFDLAGNIPLSNIGRFDALRRVWEPLGDGVYDGIATAPVVHSLALTPSRIYAGGTFGKAGGRITGFIARWNRATSEWLPLGSGVGQCEGFECNPSVAALLPEENDLYVAGNFTVAGEKPSLMIGRWTEPAPSGVESESAVVRSLTVSPAPFRERTTISFTLVDRSHVKLTVTDLAGRDIALLVDRTLSSGTHQASWDASGLPAGVYLCRVEIEGKVAVGKVVKE